MLEYDIDEAQSLLEKNLATASRNLDSLEEDLDFLRDQFTTTEVSILTPKYRPTQPRDYGWTGSEAGEVCDAAKSVLKFQKFQQCRGRTKMCLVVRQESW